MQVLQANLWWIIPAVVVLAGLALGAADVLRLSPYRVRAIAGVCYRESIRRRILLVIPLAILGVLAVSAFQRPLDVQDSVRQTLKYCIFATGLLVVITLLIVACTNLPREIDNRVIYTIVTKPTTRLEIVLGKVVGFAMVSASVLALMGLFTFMFLGFQAWQAQRYISVQLAGTTISLPERATLEAYQKFGLLDAKRVERAVKSSVLAHEPNPTDPTWWFGDPTEGDMVIPIRVARETFDPILNADEKDPNLPRVAISLTVKARPTVRNKAAAGSEPHTPTTSPATQPAKPFISPYVDPADKAPAGTKLVMVSLGNSFGEVRIDASQMGGRDVPLNALPGAEAGVGRALIPIDRKYLRQLAEEREFSIVVTGATLDTEYGVGPTPLELVLLAPDGTVIGPASASLKGIEFRQDPVDNKRQYVSYRGRQGRQGYQISGDVNGKGTVAWYQYRNAGFEGATGLVGVEMRMALERDTSEVDDNDELTKLELTFFNRDNPSSEPIKVIGYPENNRTLFLAVPAAAVSGGNFDIAVRSLTTGHWVGSSPFTLGLIVSREPFALNLSKSLLVLWMLSILVIVVAVFCSTFLSWPIAVVLTLVVLLARWGVVQLGDSLSTGIGNQVSTQLGFRDPAASEALSKSVEALAAMLRTLSSVLPDISRFSAVEHIEQGLVVPGIVLGQSGIVLALFGLPLLVMAYVSLRYKEVAP